MRRKFGFVAMLWVLALMGWFIGGTTLYIKLRFQMEEQAAVMKSTDPVLARALKFNPGDYVLADVVYETGRGMVPVPKMVVQPGDLQALVSGKGVPVRFRTGDPREVLYESDEKPWGFGWLLLGFAGTALGQLALRKLQQESA